jgi:hypothetical protein
MEWPQILIICLLVMSNTISLLNHGKIRKIDFWETLIATLIWIISLHYGGFWK